MPDAIRLEQGHIDSQHLPDLAEIIYDAFETKIDALNARQDVVLDIICSSILPEFGIFAYRGDRLVGVAGMAMGNKRLIDFQFKELRKHFNFFKALFFYLIIGLEERLPKGELKIEALAVSHNARGQGIGTRLLNYVEQYAIEQEYTFLSLDVVDTNPAAQKLYERLGFEVIRTATFGFLTRRAGFTGSHYMRKTLDPEVPDTF